MLARRLASFDLMAAARAALDLAPAAPLGTELFRRCATEAGPDIARAAAAAELAALGDNGCAGSVARDILVRGRAGAEQLRTAAETWLGCLPADQEARPRAADALVDRLPLSPTQRVALAEALVKLGHPKSGQAIARVALQHPEQVGWGIRSVVAACVTPDSADVHVVIGAIRDCGDVHVQAQAARGLADSGCVDDAISLAREVVADPAITGFDLGQAIRGWLAAGGEAALPHVHQALHSRRLPTAFWLGPVTGALAEAGHPDAAIALARENLAALVSDPWEIGTAVDAWLTAGTPAQGKEILAILRRTGPLPHRAAARLAEVFALHGCFEEAVETAEIVLATSVNFYEQVLALKGLALARGQAGAERAIATVETMQWGSLSRIALAEHVASAGHLAAARELWCSVLTRQIAPLDWVAYAASRLVTTGGTEVAFSALATDGSRTAKLRHALVQNLAGAAETSSQL
jgi:hypothetical protein